MSERIFQLNIVEPVQMPTRYYNEKAEWKVLLKVSFHELASS